MRTIAFMAALACWLGLDASAQASWLRSRSADHSSGFLHERPSLLRGGHLGRHGSLLGSGHGRIHRFSHDLTPRVFGPRAAATAPPPGYAPPPAWHPFVRSPRDFFMEEP